MIFRQFLNEPIAAASYLIGCVGTGAAAVVDPGLPAEQYALDAADRGLRIVAVLETHMHADYISTGRALARLTAARIYIPRHAGACFDHQPVDDGDRIPIGNVTIQALHTPGHTPEHTAYVVYDTPRSDQPWFVLTGDCLFIGDVGRTDLVSLPMTGPEHQYESLQKLLRLPDYVEVYPAHYGGSACGGKSMSGKIASTIGFERRFNWALQATDCATFAQWLGETPRAAVESILLHRNTNRGELPLPEDYYRPARPASPLPGELSVEPLSPEAAWSAAQSGAVLIDLRPQQDFAAGHPRGALNIAYNKDALRQRVEGLTEPGEPLVLLGDSPFVARAAAELLAAGRDKVYGYVDATAGDWAKAGLPTDSLPTLSIDELRDRVRSGVAQILDVRDPFEWEKGTIPGALLIRIEELRGRLDDIPRDRLIVTACESGTRASSAASLLRRMGYERVENVAPDGISAYLTRYPEG